jgi:hypothetical protein
MLFRFADTAPGERLTVRGLTKPALIFPKLRAARALKA